VEQQLTEAMRIDNLKRRVIILYYKVI